MRRFLLLLLAAWPGFARAALPLTAQQAIADGVLPNISDVRFQHGDDPRWARPDFDDRGWTAGSLRDLPSRDGIYWLRFRVRDVADCDAVNISVVASYDLYWDGHLLGRSGSVGATRDDELPGPLDNAFRLPNEVNGPGEHVVALRLSSFHTGFPTATYSVVFRVTQLREFMLFKARVGALMMVGTGGALLVGIVFGLFWLVADRRAAVGWFALACMGAGLERGLQAWRWLEPYSYDLHYSRLLAITGVVAVLGVVRVTFLVLFFEVRRAGAWIAVLLVAMALAWPLSPLYNAKAIALGWCALGISCGVALLALHEKRRGATFVLAGLAVSWWGLAQRPADFLEQSFIYNSGAAILGCVMALMLQLRDERRAARESQLAAARLEVELLKKHIQPHFLLNTLATIMEIIEQEPKTAVALIEALAGEFRILARVSGEKLIPLEQELALCRAHLRVMSLRKGARCQLIVAREVDERTLVPPALFHTLVENGLTHLLPRGGEQRFELRAETAAARVRFEFVAHGEPAHPGAAAREPAPAAEGTGLRYIKARLEESFPGHWTLEGGPCPDGWRTAIEIDGAGAPLPRRDESATPLTGRLAGPEREVSA